MRVITHTYEHTTLKCILVCWNGSDLVCRANIDFANFCLVTKASQSFYRISLLAFTLLCC